MPNCFKRCLHCIAKWFVFKKGQEKVRQINTDGMGFFGLTARDIDENLVKFSDWRNENIKAFLIVNVATR